MWYMLIRAYLIVFNIVLTCMVGSHVIRVYWGRNRSFYRALMVENRTTYVVIHGCRAQPG